MIEEGEDPSLPGSAVSVPPAKRAGTQHIPSKSSFQPPSCSLLGEMRSTDGMRLGNENSELFNSTDQLCGVRMDATQPTDLSRECPASQTTLPPAGGCTTNADSAEDATQIWNPSIRTTENIGGLDTSGATENIEGDDGTKTPLSDPIPRQSPAARFTVQGNATSRDVGTLRENNETVTMTPTCFEDRPKSRRHKKKRGAHRNRQVATVVPPKTQPCNPRPQKSTGQPHRERRKRRRYRSPSLGDYDSDDPDDSDDDDYVDSARCVSDQRRPTKRPRQIPMANTNQPERENMIGSQLGGLSLPDVATVSRGTLTCEIFEREIIYQLSWVVGRESSDDLQQTEHLPEQASDSRETSSAPEDESHTPPKRKSAKKLWTEQEDADLKRLKEEDGLPWSRIKEYFPHRKKGAIMVHYHTKLKDQAVAYPSLPTPSDDGDLDVRSPPSSPSTGPDHPDRRDRRHHSPHARAESSHRYRYGAPRSRRGVERYAP